MSNDPTRNPFRALPSVDRILEDPRLEQVPVGAALRAQAARAAVAQARAAVRATGAPPDVDAVLSDAVARAWSLGRPTLRPVLNATGVVVHTNLGRAPLSADALDAARAYCNLELRLIDGRRGGRHDHAGRHLTALSGAEDALVVNNNAAAVVLMLAAHCEGRDVLVSRGELVEIGGSFRVPEIMAASGARLVEVGTTNKTYAEDFARAVTPDTAAILRAHPSNYRIRGFTHAPTSEELVAVAREHAILALHDLGTGTFGPRPEGLGDDTDPVAEIAAGFDVVSFSGDKMLGGPQAGICLGRHEAIDAMRRHPLARALRADKLTVGVLEHTLLAYRTGDADRVPVRRMLHARPETLRSHAETLARCLTDALPEGEITITIQPSDDAVGGGSHPDETLPGYAVALTPGPGGPSVRALADRLRRGPSQRHADDAQTPNVLARIQDGQLLLAVRTLPPGAAPSVARAVARALTAD